MSEFLKISVNPTEVAEKLGRARALIEEKLVKAIESLSISAHAYIVQKAKSELSEFHQKYFLGLGQYGKNAAATSSKAKDIDPDIKHVRWIKVSDGIWVVEIDEKADWIEHGRPETFMGEEWWLLKPGKAKTAKDGSKYRAIPMPQMKGNKPTFSTGALGEGPGADIARLVRSAAKKQGVSLTQIEKTPEGAPKLGVLHKLNVKEPKGGQSTHGLFYSRPRTHEESQAVGLKPHEGIYRLSGAAVVQRKDEGGKVNKEVVAFRVISSKHRADNRWMYPAVQPLNAIPAAHKWAEDQLGKIIKAIDEELSR